MYYLYAFTVINKKYVVFSKLYIGLATKSFRFFHDFQSKFNNTNNKH